MSQMWSEHNPKLQVFWDATSLDAFAFCPRHYQYSIIEGWRGSAVDLEFGGYMASALERYQKARLAGASREAALMPVLHWLLAETWNEDGSQWGGEWETFWRCTGTEPYKNAKGNRAKCPFSHKGKWFPMPTPGDECGECGSPLETEFQYVPGDDKKHRINLLRAMIWYVEDQPEDMDDGLQPYVFPDGTPAVELSWKLPFGDKNRYGEDYYLAGHIDYIGRFGNEIGPVDNKTTGHTLNGGFFAKYAPSTQFDTYDVAAQALYASRGLDMDWIAVDAIQLMKDTVRTGRHFYRKDAAQREEHLRDLGYLIRRAEDCAEDTAPGGSKGYWPMEKRNCWICPFKKVCAETPRRRESVLKDTFVLQHWDPTEER